MRMVRIVVIMVALLAAGATVGGCGRAGTPGDPIALPTGETLVAQVRYTGGFVPIEWTLINAPKLAVYANGTVVVDARSTLTLSPAEVRDLVATIRKNLSAFGTSVEAGGNQQVADAPTTQLSVINADGSTHTVSAYALGIVKNYPAALLAANETLTRLADRVATEGARYTAGRVRLVANDRGEPGHGQVKPWPAGVPVPPVTASRARSADLNATASAALIAAVPELPAGGGAWPVLRTKDGLLLGVSWRYLLPHE